MPNWVLPASIAVLVTALVATSATAVVQSRAAEQARDERDALAAEVEQLQDEVDELHARLDRSEGAAGDRPGDVLGGLDGDLGRLLDELLGGTDDGHDPDLGGLLDDLLGGGGLLGSGAPPGAACLTSGLGDGFDPGDLLGGSSVPTDLDALVEQVGDQVAELRELPWEDDIEVAFLDDVQTRARLDELTELDPAERAATQAAEHLLVALRAVDDDLDLEAVQQQLLGDTVAGFYVPETAETVVRVPEDGSPGPADRITLAHELDHALTDQVLGLPDRGVAPLADDRDAATASLALIEGDASLLMSQWTLAHLSLIEQLQLATDPAIVASGDDLEGIPAVIAAELLFPYTAGLDFVCDRYLDGGWAAIDALYAEPPTTTAEILFGEPVDPVVPTGLRAPAPTDDELARTTFGAAELGFHLDAPGGDPDRGLDDVRGRLAAWGGGEAVVWTDGSTTAAGLALHDTGAGTTTLCETMTGWAAVAFDDASRRETAGIVTFDGPRSAAVSCPGDAVLVGLAEAPATAAGIVGGGTDPAAR